MDDDRRPFHGRDVYERVAERFSIPPSDGNAEFRMRPVGEPVDRHSIRDVAPQSPLVQHDLTTVYPRRMTFLERGSDGKYPKDLPCAFSWAAAKGEDVCLKSAEPRLIFTEAEEGGRACGNDFLVERAEKNPSKCEAKLISKVLLEVIAHRRSMLFGLALANRFVNVMLPHTLLNPVSSDWERCGCGCGCECKCGAGSWILQPVISLIRDGRDPRDFRRMYSLTLFLVPVEVDKFRDRTMSKCEIDWTVNAGWGLASSPFPAKVPRFTVDGPLRNYISRLARFDLASLLDPSGQPGSHTGASAEGGCRPLTLREVAELIAFGASLGVAQGRGSRVGRHATRRIGRDVMTSLGSARVSSVVVVDPNPTKEDLRDPPEGTAPPPGALGLLMKTLGGETRVPSRWSVAQQRKYRLDRPFVDKDTYAAGVLPLNRCLITTSDAYAQHGRRESGLMQAGNAAYMTIGAATAIGTLRAIDHDLERMEGAEPTKIADIEGEIAVDLQEIYDLDITREAYRHQYRLLRERLGITRDYQTLQDKMQALGRETTTRHEVKAQAQLAWLTVVIVALTVLLLIVTLAK